MSHVNQELRPTTNIGYTSAYQESLPSAFADYVGVGYTDRIVRVRELADIIGISKSSIYERLREGSSGYDPSFPRPIRLGARSVGWLLSSIQRWLSEQA